MTILVDVWVAGLPKTKGSLTARPNGTLRNSEASSHWRVLMAGAVRDDYNARYGGGPAARPAPYAGPVAVSMTFALPVDPLAHGAGDLDKLERNVLDALGTTSRNPRYNGGVIVDDNLVVRIASSKGGPLPQPGVHIIVGAL